MIARIAGRQALVALALVLVAPRVGAGEQAVLDPTRGEVRLAAAVPRDKRQQGQVRLLERDSVTVVQTVLHSKVLRRVIGGILEKEAGNWPADSPGYASSQRYCTALEEALAEILTEQRGAGEERVRTLVIEFLVLASTGYVVVTGAGVDSEAGDVWRVDGTRPPSTTLELPPDYVRRNMLLIVADSFGVDLDAARRMLEDPDSGGWVGDSVADAFGAR